MSCCRGSSRSTLPRTDPVMRLIGSWRRLARQAGDGGCVPRAAQRRGLPRGRYLARIPGTGAVEHSDAARRAEAERRASQQRVSHHAARRVECGAALELVPRKGRRHAPRLVGAGVWRHRAGVARYARPLARGREGGGYEEEPREEAAAQQEDSSRSIRTATPHWKQRKYSKPKGTLFIVAHCPHRTISVGSFIIGPDPNGRGAGEGEERPASAVTVMGKISLSFFCTT